MSYINNEILNTYYEDIKNRKSMIYCPWEREKNRKERGKYQYEQMLNRYNEECGECIVISPAKKVN